MKDSSLSFFVFVFHEEIRSIEDKEPHSCFHIINETSSEERMHLNMSLAYKIESQINAPEVL